MAAPATLTAANSAAGTTSQRARPRSVPTRSPTAQTTTASPNATLIPVLEPWAITVPAAATTSAMPKVTRPRGEGGCLGGTGDATSSTRTGMGGGADPSTGEAARGDQSAIATPMRTSTRPAGPVSMPHQSPPDTASSHIGSTSRPTTRRATLGVLAVGPLGSSSQPARYAATPTPSRQASTTKLSLVHSGATPSTSASPPATPATIRSPLRHTRWRGGGCTGGGRISDSDSTVVMRGRYGGRGGSSIGDVPRSTLSRFVVGQGDAEWAGR